MDNRTLIGEFFQLARRFLRFRVAVKAIEANLSLLLRSSALDAILDGCFQSFHEILVSLGRDGCESQPDDFLTQSGLGPHDFQVRGLVVFVSPQLIVDVIPNR